MRAWISHSTVRKATTWPADASCQNFNLKLKGRLNTESADALVRKRNAQHAQTQQKPSPDYCARFALNAGEGARAPSIGLTSFCEFLGKADLLTITYFINVSVVTIEGLTLTALPHRSFLLT